MSDDKICVSEFITSNYLEYGKYVALHRAVVNLDGLKPVQRRVMIGLNNIAKGKLVSTINAIGEVSKYHPFGDLSLANSIAEMARIESIDSQGSFGQKLIEKIPHAAPRYTKVGLTDDQAAYYFTLKDYVTEVEGEEKLEPDHLIVPVPYSLIYGSFSWGVGLVSRMPAFTYDSILEAYAKDDPYLLKSKYGYTVNMDNSNMESIWYHGIGRIALEMKVARLDYNTILIMGSGEAFRPSIATFRDEIAEGQVTIENRSKDRIELIVRRTPRARRIDMDEVHRRCIKLATNSRKYQIQVVDSGQVVTLGMRDWVGRTLTDFKDKYETYKNDRITSLERNITIFKLLPEVGRLLLEGRSERQIAKELETPLDIIKECMQKTISMLRKANHTPKITAFKKRIKEVRSEDVDSIIKNFKL